MTTAPAKALQSQSPNPYVFIVGCPRSGTTLLRRIVDAHLQIAITPETHWIPRYFKERIGLTPEGLVTPAFSERLAEYRTFPNLEIAREELEKLVLCTASAPYATFVSALFDLYGRARGKPLVGDKTPGYVRDICLLHQLWPQAKFVHLIRDGRDTCLSAVNWKRKVPDLARRFPTWNEDPVTTAAFWWQWHVRQAQQAGETLGDALYYEMRYESLVGRPAAECTGLCAFLGVPRDDRMIRFHEGRATSKPDRDAKHGWLPITPGLRDWRTQMLARDLEHFEAAAGPLLDTLCYPRAFPQPSPEARQWAAKIGSLFPKNATVQRSALSEL